jgi:hypothetical protein
MGESDVRDGRIRIPDMVGPAARLVISPGVVTRGPQTQEAATGSDFRRPRTAKRILGHRPTLALPAVDGRTRDMVAAGAHIRAQIAGAIDLR